MMIRQKFALWVMLAFLAPVPANAQLVGPGWNRCNSCPNSGPQFVHRVTPIVPQGLSCCPPVVLPRVSHVVAQPLVQACPQVQTSYCQEQFTTYQPVTRTQVRREALTIDVPVTTHKQVTVDEGGYQLVWIPKVTTKTVAETHIQKQVQYRDVPYQVVEHVPPVQTRMVPQQTVQYLPRAVMVAKPCCQSQAFSSASVPLVSTIPYAVSQFPVTPAPNSQSTQAHVPEPTTIPQADPKWVKVPQIESEQGKAQANSEIELQSFERSLPVRSAKGMFSRPTATASALRVGSFVPACGLSVGNLE